MHNALSIDIEEYFHANAFDYVVGGPDHWDEFASRVELNAPWVLEVLSETNTKATFFILGWVAERHPGLVKEIHNQGHEIASHGYAHCLIYNQTPDQLQEDLFRSLDILQDITGEKVLGYRAPSFSIVPESIWALDIIESCGFKYDSSIYPALPLVHNRYGYPEATIEPHKIQGNLWEFPMTVIDLFGKKFPLAGGGWFRHYPYFLTRWGIKKVNAEGRPAIVYLHPWEVDPDQPKINGSLYKRYLHYHNINRTKNRLRKLCQEFQFAPIKHVLNL